MLCLRFPGSLAPALSAPVRRATAGLVLAVGAIALGIAASVPGQDTSPEASRRLPEGVRLFESGWRLRPLQRLPEEVTSVVVSDWSRPAEFGYLYLGTSPVGGVYKVNAGLQHP